MAPHPRMDRAHARTGAAGAGADAAGDGIPTNAGAGVVVGAVGDAAALQMASPT